MSIKSKIKNIRKIATRTSRNRAVRSELRTLEKRFQNAEGLEETQKAAQLYISALEKAAKRVVVHYNKVSRKKANCDTAINKLKVA